MTATRACTQNTRWNCSTAVRGLGLLMVHLFLTKKNVMSLSRSTRRDSHSPSFVWTNCPSKWYLAIISLRHIALAHFGLQMMWCPLLGMECHLQRHCLLVTLTHWCFAWNLQYYHLTSMGILHAGYPGQRENHTLARVVCLNSHSNTDLITHTVIHKKDWWLWMILLHDQVSLTS